MKAVSNYKAMIEELSTMAWIFARFQDNPLKETAKEQGWTLETISKIQVKVQASADMADRIKDEIIGDGDEAKFVGRTKTTFFELNGKPSFAPSYFPEFDDACFELPSKEHPDRNKELADALLLVYGDEAAMMMVRLGATFEMANFIVQDVCSMLDEVCKFVGYNPEQPESQPSFLQIEKVVQAFERGIEHGYMTKQDGNYKWIKDKGTLLCALIGTLLFGDEIGLDGDYKTKGGAETFPASDIEKYFGLKDISKKRYQLNLKKPPRGYKEMIKKLIEQP